jgi:hypothetical protein
VVAPELVTFTRGFVPVMAKDEFAPVVVSQRLPPLAFTVIFPLEPNAIALVFELELLKNPVVSVKFWRLSDPLVRVVMRPEPTVILSFNCDVPTPANITGQSIVLVFDVIVLVFPDDGRNVQALVPDPRFIDEFKVKSPYIVSTLLFTVPV